MQKQILRFLAFFLAAAFLIRTDASCAEASGWPLSAIGEEAEYDGSGIRIAVIDTGITTAYLDATHVLEGKNYLFPDSGTDDLIGHGTYIAGILLGSRTLNLEGVAPECVLVPLIYYSRYPSGVPVNGGVDMVVKAIYDAIDIYECNVINLSLGIPYEHTGLTSAIAYAEEKGVSVVAAAGNDNHTDPQTVFYPAAYKTVIGVGASGPDMQAIAQSQRNHSVLLLAPGKEVPVVPIGNRAKPQAASGTSYAATFVTGAIARLLECDPTLTPAQIREILTSTATDIGAAGYDTDSGWGLLNLSRAIAAAKEAIPSSAPISRAAFITLLYRMEKKSFPENPLREEPYFGASIPETHFPAPFPDVSHGVWYADAVVWAASVEIVHGSGGQFRPHSSMTREDMVTILFRYAQYKGYGVVGQIPDLAGFTDAASISAYARGAFDWAYGCGIIAGTSRNSLSPKDFATVRQAVLVLTRFSDRIGAS